MADFIAEIDMACFVNDCVGNMSLKLMNERYAAFNQKIRARCPRLPILLMTFIRRAEEQYQPELAKIADDRNAVVFRTFKEFRKRGDRNVHLLECRDLIGFQADHPSVDGAHLSDLGFWRLANEVAPKLKMILNLK